jgi:hypothetical protein
MLKMQMAPALVKLFNIEVWIEKGGWVNKFLQRQDLIIFLK